MCAVIVLRAGLRRNRDSLPVGTKDFSLFQSLQNGSPPLFQTPIQQVQSKRWRAKFTNLPFQPDSENEWSHNFPTLIPSWRAGGRICLLPGRHCARNLTLCAVFRNKSTFSFLAQQPPSGPGLPHS